MQRHQSCAALRRLHVSAPTAGSVASGCAALADSAPDTALGGNGRWGGCGALVRVPLLCFVSVFIAVGYATMTVVLPRVETTGVLESVRRSPRMLMHRFAASCAAHHPSE